MTNEVSNKRVQSVLGAILITLLCVGCTDWKDYTRPRTEIEAFYYHERGRYSAATINEGEVEMVNVPSAIITLDAVGSSWFSCNYMQDRTYGRTTGGCYVHLRSVDDINTASWNHGKFGSGKTSRMN